MSITYSIHCLKCNEELWVGQRSAGGKPYLYGRQSDIEKLTHFLLTHERHKLAFCMDMDGSDISERIIE